MDKITITLEILICIFSVLNVIKHWNTDRKTSYKWLAVAIAAIIFILI